MKSFTFIIKLAGSVEADTYEQAEAKLNAHLDELGAVDSDKHDLTWPDASFDLEYYEADDADAGYDLSADAEALASAGFGTDEDYGGW